MYCKVIVIENDQMSYCKKKILDILNILLSILQPLDWVQIIKRCRRRAPCLCTSDDC